MEKGDLLNKLYEIEHRLPLLLTSPTLWNTLDVDYEPPRVERLWHQFDDTYRVYLHRTHPCEKGLFHPHPWPSAVHVLSGQYLMDVGWSEAAGPPPVAATIKLCGDAEYEMLDPRGWHSVRPLAVPSLSVMITGRPWKGDNGSPRPTKPLNPLSDETKAELLHQFQYYFRLH